MVSGYVTLRCGKVQDTASVQGKLELAQKGAVVRLDCLGGSAVVSGRVRPGVKWGCG